jgi:hypothetical protein
MTLTLLLAHTGVARQSASEWIGERVAHRVFDCSVAANDEPEDVLLVEHVVGREACVLFRHGPFVSVLRPSHGRIPGG